MTDQKLKDLNDKLVKELVKKGLTVEAAQEAINKTKLTTDELMAILQEAQSFEDQIKEVELSTIPTLAKEGFDKSLELNKEYQKLAKLQGGHWILEWTQKHFPAMDKSLEALNTALAKETTRLTSKEYLDSIIKKRGDENFDTKEVQLENELALYRLRRKLLPEIDAKFNVNDQMRKEFNKALNAQSTSRTKSVSDKIDKLNSELVFIQETIAKTLFISLEEASIIISNINFFSTVFDTLITIERTHGALVSDAIDAELDNVVIGSGWIERNLSNSFPFKVLKANVSKAYTSKQNAMKAKIEKLRAEKRDN